MSPKLAVAAAFVLSTFTARAETPPPSWGVETELVWPFIPGVGVFTAKATRTLWGAGTSTRGEVFGGLYARPHVPHNVVEFIDEYAVIAGVRQYFWRGAHVELGSYSGWASGTRNKIDGKDYSHFAWLGEVDVGYRFDFFEHGGVYVLPQFGAMKGISTNIGPRATPDFFVTGKLIVGTSF